MMVARARRLRRLIDVAATRLCNDKARSSIVDLRRAAARQARSPFLAASRRIMAATRLRTVARRTTSNQLRQAIARRLPALLSARRRSARTCVEAAPVRRNAARIQVRQAIAQCFAALLRARWRSARTCVFVDALAARRKRNAALICRRTPLLKAATHNAAAAPRRDARTEAACSFNKENASTRRRRTTAAPHLLEKAARASINPLERRQLRKRRTIRRTSPSSKTPATVRAARSRSTSCRAARKAATYLPPVGDVASVRLIQAVVARSRIAVCRSSKCNAGDSGSGFIGDDASMDDGGDT
mmetsp:Transcript_10919/g.32438  ORF Transcript_10919/g.32438 Transcript_10919/m.32438 type:complete len:301 (-) Transcript_10919:398-1300(-)